MPSFGQVIRGYRFGFHWVSELQAFMRIDAQPGPPYRVDLVPEDKLPKSKKIGSGEHKVFWESGEDYLAMSSRLRQIKRVKQPVTLWLDDEGN